MWLSPKLRGFLNIVQTGDLVLAGVVFHHISSPCPALSQTFCRCRMQETNLKMTLHIPKMSVRIDWTDPELKPTSQAISRRFRLLSHMTRLCTISTVSSVVASFGCLDHSSSSVLSLQNSETYFFTLLRRLVPKGFHEIFMNFLGRHSLLTEILYD